jgi:RNA polymerase sigma-70 factor (ECF subfamily)
MSDRSLILEWRQRWNRSLFQFLKRRAPSSVDVQDLAQETYLRLLRARDLSEVRNPLAYLLQVASHVALDWCDRQPRLDAMEPLEDEMFSDDLLPELELDATMFRKRLDETLATFSPMMRAVLLLKLRDERSHQQIAADLNLSARQVRRYLARGYERLRRALEE